ncbi:unnamed protein product [Adineta steineri]|uniref:Uncharacterized protein n=1 Tax=Adineta steineri TaxID=433720 RepID=A0A813YN11_9BILA|nr:unnamed protein product [Adineta steineri]CAF0883228.1 unnamed protein product [Adineta steineri]CAF0886534.1 unnamed protein product [Adineta steineri]CAF0886689.1 unnamed protein product [Adineta steineri]CAF1003000.1 unnamed protein product [Adineta steineri]
MRMTLINTILCLFIALIGITLSSSSSLDNDDYATANSDWNQFDSYYPTHFLNVRAAKSRFWKRAPPRKFWKRSLDESTMNNNDMDNFQQQEKH